MVKLTFVSPQYSHFNVHMLRVNHWFKLTYKKDNIFLEKYFGEVALRKTTTKQQKKKKTQNIFLPFFLSLEKDYKCTHVLG